MKKLSYHIIVVAIFLFVAAGCGTVQKGVTATPVSQKETKDATVNVAPWSVNVQSAASDRLLLEARSWLGTPYLYGGTSTDGVDCSGFVLQVFQRALNINLPRNSAKQQEYCLPVSREQLAVGDLVFFSSKNSDSVAHVGIYIGDRQFIHSSTSKGVVVSSLDQKYYTDNFHSFGRIASFARLNTVRQPDVKATQIASKPAFETASSKTPSSKSRIRTETVVPPPSTAAAMASDREKALKSIFSTPVPELR